VRRTAIEEQNTSCNEISHPKISCIRKHAVSPTRVVALESISLRLVADLMLKLMGRIANMGPSKKNKISSRTSRLTFMFKIPWSFCRSKKSKTFNKWFAYWTNHDFDSVRDYLLYMIAKVCQGEFSTQESRSYFFASFSASRCLLCTFLQFISQCQQCQRRGIQWYSHHNLMHEKDGMEVIDVHHPFWNKNRCVMCKHEHINVYFNVPLKIYCLVCTYL